MSADEYKVIKRPDGSTGFERIHTPPPPRTYGDVSERGWWQNLYGGPQMGSGQQNYGGQGQQYAGSYGHGSYGASNKVLAYIAVVDKDNKEIAQREVTEYWKDWWELAAKEFKVYTEDKKYDLMVIPEAAVKSFSEGHISFNACTYTAAKDYMEAWWGKTLHDSDREWLARHPLAKDDGIPTEYTATAMQQLLEPYGYQVVRVRFRAGSLNAGDEPMKWIKALGCNPMGMVDRRTSNAEYAKKTGMPLEQVNDIWRFEYHEEPLRPSIVGERGWSSGSGVTAGGGGGHAKYQAPRAGSGDWVVSVQLAPTSEVKYHQPPEMPEYIKRRGKLTFSLEDVRREDGTAFAIRVNNWFLSPEEAAERERAAKEGGAAGAAGFPGTDRKGVEANQVSGEKGTQGSTQGWQAGTSGALAKHACIICTRKFELKEFPQDMFVCQSCLNRSWTGWSCGVCSKPLGVEKERVPDYIPGTGQNGNMPVFRCPHEACKKDIELPATGGTLLNRIKLGIKQFEDYLALTRVGAMPDSKDVLTDEERRATSVSGQQHNADGSWMQ